MTRTVRDAALMLNVMAGPDERDPHSLPLGGVDYLRAAEGGVRGLRVAWSPNLGYAVVDPEVQRVADAAAKRFADLGGDIEQADPGFDDPEPIWAVFFYTGIGTRLAAFLPEWRDRMDPPLVGIIEEAQAIPATKLVQAAFQRTALWDTVRKFFARYDLLLTPTLAVPPFGIGLNQPPERQATHLGWVVFTYPFNLTGQPAATVPCGFTADGLPVGLQIVGRRFDDATVLRAAAAFEGASPWAHRRPPLD